MTAFVENLVGRLADAFGVPLWDVNGFLAILLVSVVCGLVSPLVVGGRMAFFSDAMAHTAFAGAAVGMLVLVVAFGVKSSLGADAHAWLIPAVMVTFGAIVGAGIAFVRERTGLTADTVIGVFFALAIGFGAMLIPELTKRVKFDPEQFLFGSPMYASAVDLVFLAALVVVSAAFLVARYNGLVFASFNPSLARSRGVGVRLNNYLFIILLSLVVNLSITAVGVLLINALLVVPAAAAANLSRDLRQMFKLSVAASVGCGVLGFAISRNFQLDLGGTRIPLRPGGTIVMLVVGWFFLSVGVAYLRGRRAVASLDCDC